MMQQSAFLEYDVFSIIESDLDGLRIVNIRLIFIDVIVFMKL